jgi:hypothetical protein
VNASSFAAGTVEYTGAPEAFAEWLRARALSLEAWEGETPIVRTLRRVAQELDASFRRGAIRHVGLAEAAQIGGYSISHLGRLLRENPERNVGTKHRPAFAYRDVPRKPGYQSPQSDHDTAAVSLLHLEPATPTAHPSVEAERRRSRSAGPVGSRLLAAKAGGMRR